MELDGLPLTVMLPLAVALTFDLLTAISISTSIPHLYHNCVNPFIGFYPHVTTLRSGLCYRKSVCLSVTFLRRGLKLSAIFLRHLVP